MSNARKRRVNLVRDQDVAMVEGHPEGVTSTGSLDGVFRAARRIVNVPAIAFPAFGVLVGVIAVVDYLTGEQVSFSLFYLIPVGSAAWFVGRRAASFLAVLCAVCWLANDPWLARHAYAWPWLGYWNAAMRLCIFLIVADLLSRLRQTLLSVRQAHTGLMNAHEQLFRVRREQLALKDQLLSHVSHELRTPLTAAHQFLTIVLDGIAGQPNEQQREYLEISLRNMNQLARMISNLLDSTRCQSGKLEMVRCPMSLGDTIPEVVEALRPAALEKGVSMTSEIAPGVPQVLADRQRVQEILTNLLENAIKFTPPGGRIGVRAAASGDHPGFAVVSVEDTGRGIPPRARKDLFQRLYQVEREDAGGRHGLGLGLFLCSEFVSQHGGRIWVDSEPGRGSTFHFTLPFANDDD
jgi:signal transduction histidine kinase